MKHAARILWAAAFLSAVWMACGLAQPLVFEGGAPEITVTDASGERVVLQEDTLQLLGRDEEGNYLLFARGGYYTADAGALEDVLYGADTGELTTPKDYSLLSKPSQNGRVLALQKALDQLGYLEGTVDGDFGNRTENALYAFQADQELEQTGQADPLLQMLIFSVIGEPLAIVPPDPALPYAAIADRVDVDMEPIYQGRFSFEYDDMAGVGLISAGAPVEYDASGESDLEKYQFTLRFGLYVREGEDGRVTIQPAALIDCLCVRRPMMSEVIVKSGDNRAALPVTELTSSLSGPRSVEHGLILLSPEAAAALSGAEEAGELKVRVTGEYRSFDIDIPLDALSGISRVAHVAEQLR